MAAGQTLRQQRLDETEVGDAKFVTISELPGVSDKPATDDLVGELGAPRVGEAGLLDSEVYASIYNAGKQLLLGSWRAAYIVLVGAELLIAWQWFLHRRMESATPAGSPIPARATR